MGHTVRAVVTATNSGGSTPANSAPTAVVSLPPAPTAAFMYGPSSPVTGSRSVTSTGPAPPVLMRRARIRGTTMAASLPVGSWPLGTGATTQFTFQQAATKYVRLTVQDAAGRTATVEHDVVVSTPPVSAPSNTALPQITGTTTAGQQLATSNGSWSGSPTSYTYQWQDCDTAGANCGPIGGATSSGYKLTPSDVGHTVRAVITATNSGGSTPANSAPTAVVSLPPAPTAAFMYGPSSPVTGSAVSLDGTGSTCADAPCAYTWDDDGGEPPVGSWPLGTGVTTQFTFQQAATKYVRLTVQDAAGRTATVEHDVVVSTPPVSAPSNTALPQITGTTTAGQQLTTSNGSWSGSPTSYTYQWQDCDTAGANCGPIGGATSSGYKLTPSDVGHTVRAVITATNSGGSGQASSDPSAVIAAAPISPPSNTALPQASGTTTQGQKLTSTTGSWSGSPTSYGYQWRDCDTSGGNCSNIAGAAGSSYTLASSEVGHTLRVVVTATNSGGSTSATSNQTATVGSGTSQTTNCFGSPGACGYPDPSYSWNGAGAWQTGGGGVGPNNGTTSTACSSLPSSGSITTSSNGQVIQNLNITGTIVIQNSNVTVNNVCITNNGNASSEPMRSRCWQAAR